MNNLLGFVEQRKKMEAEAPTVQVGATPTERQPNPHNLPKFLQAGCPSCRPTAWFTTAYLYISQLATISGGRSPIHHLGTRLVACSKAPTIYIGGS